MSKLNTIKQHLETVPSAVVVTESTYENGSSFSEALLRGNIGKIEIVDYVVAPKKGLYTAGELQTFMMDIVPSTLTPDVLNHFRADEEFLYLGSLGFTDKLAEEQITGQRAVRVIDEDLKKSFVDRTYPFNVIQSYDRHISIRVFPDETIARDTPVKGMGGLISLRDLLSYKLSLDTGPSIRRAVNRKVVPRVL